MAKSSKPEAWYERDPQRLRQDIDDMLWHFPTFSYAIEDNTVVWQGHVRVITPEGRFKEHELSIQCYGDYPRTAPRVYRGGGFPAFGRWRPPHLFGDDSLCLFYPNDEPVRRWTENDKLPTIVAWACEWLHAYEYWRLTQQWPGREAPHRKSKKRKKKR